MHYSSPRKPALVWGPSVGRYFAWNEDGRLICHSRDRQAVLEKLVHYGYDVVGPNSRIAATIRDKMRIDRGIVI